MHADPPVLAGFLSTHPVLRVGLIAIVAVAVVLALTALFTTVGVGPTFEIAPDPAGLLPF